MSENFDENIEVKDFSSTEDISNETTLKTLFSPETRILDEEPVLDKNSEFLNKNVREVPAVLLSPCSRRTSLSEQGLRSGCSCEFLVPPSPLNTLRNNSTASPAEEQKTGRISPRKLSLLLSLTRQSSADFIINGSPFNEYSGDSTSISLQDKCVPVEKCSEDQTSSEFSFRSHSCLTSSLRASTSSLKAPYHGSRPSETTKRLRLPVAISTPNLDNLYQNRSACCRRPSTQLCCLLPTNYAALSTPLSSECSLRFSDQNFENSSDEKNERLLPNEFHYCIEDESEEPLLPTGAATKSSGLVITEQQSFLPPKHENGDKQHSTPDLRLNETLALPSDWRGSQGSLAEESDALKVKRASSRVKSPQGRRSDKAPSIFLHPDSARCLSFEGSAVSLLEACSSRMSDVSRKRRAFADSKKLKLQHQSSSLQSSASSAFEESSIKSDTSSVVKSFFSLISPSRLLAKLSASIQSVRSTDSRATRRKRRQIDCPEDTKIVTLNVSGRYFKINDYFLSVHPNTLLGSKARSCFYDNVRNEFFFDRDPDCFRYIWNFYQSGELHCPREECVQSFLDEVAYFGLDISTLCDCCWQETFEPAYDKLTKRRAELQEAKKEAAEAIHVLAPDATFREKVWITLQEPSFSFNAKMFYLTSVFVIAISVVTNTAETIACKGAIRICQEENEETYFYIDTLCVGFFTFEFIARLIFCPNRLQFLITIMSIVDLLAILPYYVNLLLTYFSVGTSSGMDAFVVLRVLRTLRVFKLLRHSKMLKKLTQSMRESAAELGLIGFVYMVMVILFSSIIYFAELSDDTQFTSIPQAMWYAVITSTTAG